ncbi:MAG: SGNH/GDSL hydrolase family protein [Caulobacterales bacterium]
MSWLSCGFDRLATSVGLARRARQPRAWPLVAAALTAAMVAPTLARAAPAAADTLWVATWEASPEPQRAPLIALTGQTVRQVARVSLGGRYLRVRLSNEFGDRPLTIGAAHMALAAGAGSATQPGTDRALTFGGSAGITIPTGARVLSDPVLINAPPLSNVSVSVYFPAAVGAVTEDYFALATGYMAPGDATAAPELPGAATIAKRVVLTGIDVSAPAKTQVVVALGDQLTGGYGSTVDANHRWTDRLAERLAARKGAPSPLGVVNAGIGGNRLLHDFFGPNALSRFDRDVLSQPNVGYLIVLLGINDFGFPGGRDLAAEDVSADDVIAGYRQIIQRAHSYGIKVFMATLPPFGPIPERPGYYSDASEAKRQAVNQWIRANVHKEFEDVIDFEAAVRDPRTGIRLRAAYDSGDHLDPNDAGYQAMANAVEFRLFEK